MTDGHPGRGDAEDSAKPLELLKLSAVGAELFCKLKICLTYRT